MSFVVALRRSWTIDMGIFPEVFHYECGEDMPDEFHERYSVRICCARVQPQVNHLLRWNPRFHVRDEPSRSTSCLVTETSEEYA